MHLPLFLYLIVVQLEFQHVPGFRPTEANQGSLKAIKLEIIQLSNNFFSKNKLYEVLVGIIWSHTRMTSPAKHITHQSINQLRYELHPLLPFQMPTTVSYIGNGNRQARMTWPSKKLCIIIKCKVPADGDNSECFLTQRNIFAQNKKVNGAYDHKSTGLVLINSMI